jgi:hypothetical protein
VGKAEVSFIAYKDIICARSPVFEAMCKEIWMGPGNRVIRLPDDHPESFESLLGFMNFGMIRVDVGKEEWQSSMDLTGHLFGFGALAMLWIIADKYQVAAVKNGLIDAFVDLFLGVKYKDVAGIPWSVVTLLYENTTTTSTIRRFLVSILGVYVNEDTIDEMENDLCRGFLVDYIRRTLKGDEWLDFDDDPKEICKEYHNHDMKNPASFKPCTRLKRIVNIKSQMS